MPARTGKANQGQSTVEGNSYRVFVSGESKNGIVGDGHWVTWIKDVRTRSFSYKSGDTLITLRRESRAKGQFWQRVNSGMPTKSQITSYTKSMWVSLKN
jgi:hypothetical protein